MASYRVNDPWGLNGYIKGLPDNNWLKNIGNDFGLGGPQAHDPRGQLRASGRAEAVSPTNPMGNQPNRPGGNVNTMTPNPQAQATANQVQGMLQNPGPYGYGQMSQRMRQRLGPQRSAQAMPGAPGMMNPQGQRQMMAEQMKQRLGPQMSPQQTQQQAMQQFYSQQPPPLTQMLMNQRQQLGY